MESFLPPREDGEFQAFLADMGDFLSLPPPSTAETSQHLGIGLLQAQTPSATPTILPAPPQPLAQASLAVGRKRGKQVSPYRNAVRQPNRKTRVVHMDGVVAGKRANVPPRSRGKQALSTWRPPTPSTTSRAPKKMMMSSTTVPPRIIEVQNKRNTDGFLQLNGISDIVSNALEFYDLDVLPKLISYEQYAESSNKLTYYLRRDYARSEFTRELNNRLITWNQQNSPVPMNFVTYNSSSSNSLNIPIEIILRMVIDAIGASSPSTSN